MTIYRVSTSSKIYIVLFSLFITISGLLILFVWDKESSLSKRVFVLLGILFFVCGPWAVFTVKIGTDEEKLTLFNTINVLPLFSGKKIKKGNISLQWGEIGELQTSYLLYPESADITLKPKEGVNKEGMGFSVGVGGMPLDLLRDIILHLPSDAKIKLYSRLQRKLEGKQTWFFKEQETHITDVTYWRKVWGAGEK